MNIRIKKSGAVSGKFNMATSFRKRVHSSKIHPLGTRPSIQNASLLLVSTGVPSMDALLGTVIITLEIYYF